jgi:hypothetical protein
MTTDFIMGLILGGVLVTYGFLVGYSVAKSKYKHSENKEVL